jgi:ABC-type nickel/cobalt efflux system permease component RcnA
MACRGAAVLRSVEKFRLYRACFAIALVLVLPRAAQAHPLGDFSINQYFVVDGNAPKPRIHFLLDVAEIPSFTELDMLDTDYDSELSRVEVETYLDQRIPQLARFITLSIDDRPVPLSVVRHKLILLEGNGAMIVFNILLTLEAETVWPSTPFTIGIASENYPDEQGTRECLLLPGAMRVDTTASLAPNTLGEQAPVAQSVVRAVVYENRGANFTMRLTPGAAGNAVGPIEDFSWTSTARMAQEQGEMGMAHGLARAVLDSGFRDGMPGQPKPVVSVAEGVDSENVGTAVRQGSESTASRLLNRVSEIVRTDPLPPLLLAFGLAIAAALGMGHAFAPGHGKTVMAAYLIGEQGTSWHAVILGIVVTITHTWSVILLGLVTLYFEGMISESQVNFWTGVISGVIIVAIGVILFRQRYHQLLATAGGNPGDWRFYHGHDHAADEPAALVMEPGKAPSYRNILWLGISGGVVPCPAALIVLLLALKVGRLTYGLALILAFSVGLAAVLVVIGLLVVRASRLLQQRKLVDHPLLRLLPLGSAALITLLGTWVVVWTLLQFDVLRFG